MRPASRILYFLVAGPTAAILVAGAAAFRESVPLRPALAAIWAPPEDQAFGGAVASSGLSSSAYLVIVGEPGVLTWQISNTAGAAPVPGWLQRIASRITERLSPGTPEVVRLDAVGWPLPYIVSARRDPFRSINRPRTGSIFGLGSTGLMKAGEVGNVRFEDDGARALRTSGANFWHGELAIDWPGLLLATITYGAMALLLLESSIRLRRACLRARGRCCQRSYPVGGSTICPECGLHTDSSRRNRTA